MARRSNDSEASAGSIIAIFVALVSFTVLAWLPIRKGSAACQFIGGVAIAGGLASVVWLVAAYGHPPDGLRMLAIGSGVAYGVALILRVVGAVMPVADPIGEAGGGDADDVPSFSTKNGEVVLFQGEAQFLGDKQVRMFGGISKHLGLGLRGGVGLSVPIRTMTVIDEGEFVVTNERIVFAGAARTTTLRPNRILDVAVDGDHVVVRPTNGRSLVVEVRQPEAAVGAIRSALRLAR